MTTKPLVSACIITYQHAPFIRQAIDGALMQKANFPIEILVGEDESTDGTREVCLDYQRRMPDRVRVFLRSRRDVVLIDGRPRGSFNFRATLNEARGEFIAICEGDDYWTDPEKLQRQVDYLRANPDCVGCFHDAKLVDAEGRTLSESYFSSDQEKFTQRDVIENLLSKQPTCSLVFRRTAFAEPLPEWYLRRPSDLYLDILLTTHGSLGFVRRNMGAYRKHPGGVWSGQRETNQVIELIIRYKLLLADPAFRKRYGTILLAKTDELQASLFTRADMNSEMSRLEDIVHEQTAALESAKAEHDRLESEARHARDDAQRAVSDSQKHIDELMAQLGRQRTESQKHIDELLAQLHRLSGVSTEQNAYIDSLKREIERLHQQARTDHPGKS